MGTEFVRWLGEQPRRRRFTLATLSFGFVAAAVEIWLGVYQHIPLSFLLFLVVWFYNFVYGVIILGIGAWLYYQWKPLPTK